LIESAFAASNADFFKKVMDEFSPIGSRVLDTTSGYLRLWDRLEGMQRLEGGSVYEVVYMDLRPLPKIGVIGSFSHLPFMNGSFNTLIFDPPYTSGGSARVTGDKKRLTASGAWTASVTSDELDRGHRKFESAVVKLGKGGYGEMRLVLDKIFLEFYRVLKPAGYVIMKSSDLREGNEVFPFTAYAWSKWKELLKLEALLYQVIPASGIKAGNRHVTVTHNTWSVWGHKRI